jgi:hypothetical protein
MMDINKAHCLNIGIQPKYFSLMHINIWNIFQCGTYLKISLKSSYILQSSTNPEYRILSNFTYKYQHLVLSIQTLKISLFWSRKKHVAYLLIFHFIYIIHEKWLHCKELDRVSVILSCTDETQLFTVSSDIWFSAIYFTFIQDLPIPSMIVILGSDWYIFTYVCVCVCVCVCFGDRWGVGFPSSPLSSSSWPVSG